MTTKELLEKMKNGELPKAGILGRTGAAKKIVITAQVGGETFVVPDIDLSSDGEAAE